MPTLARENFGFIAIVLVVPLLPKRITFTNR